MGVISSLQHWAMQPFSGAKMDLWGWVLFTGLIIVLIGAWTRVLNHVVD